MLVYDEWIRDFALGMIFFIPSLIVVLYLFGKGTAMAMIVVGEALDRPRSEKLADFYTEIDFLRGEYFKKIHSYWVAKGEASPQEAHDPGTLGIFKEYLERGDWRGANRYFKELKDEANREIGAVVSEYRDVAPKAHYEIGWGGK
jgi:hypothetical protein